MRSFAGVSLCVGSLAVLTVAGALPDLSLHRGLGWLWVYSGEILLAACGGALFGFALIVTSLVHRKAARGVTWILFMILAVWTTRQISSELAPLSCERLLLRTSGSHPLVVRLRSTQSKCTVELYSESGGVRGHLLLARRALPCGRPVSLLGPSPAGSYLVVGKGGLVGGLIDGAKLLILLPAECYSSEEEIRQDFRVKGQILFPGTIDEFDSDD
jgi:hypothetical protein